MVARLRLLEGGVRPCVAGFLSSQHSAWPGAQQVGRHSASIRFTVDVPVLHVPAANCRGSACLGRRRHGCRTTGQPIDQGCRGNHRRCAHRLARAISDPRRQAKCRSIGGTEGSNGRDRTSVYSEELRYPVPSSPTTGLCRCTGYGRAASGGFIRRSKVIRFQSLR
jgi:hypothetical protein